MGMQNIKKMSLKTGNKHSLYFNALGEHVEIKSSGVMGGVSVSFWVKALQSGVRQVIASGLMDNYIIYFDADGRVGSGSATTVGVATSIFGIDNGNWYHLYIQKNGVNDYTIYVNGINRSGGGSGGWRSTNATYIAYCHPNLPFKGNIDRVQVYSRFLNEKEIQLLYKGMKISTVGLIANWNFNEGVGTKLHDISGNLNHGTLINDPVWSTDVSAR